MSAEQLWARLEDFLHEVVPVAEEAGVRLAAHPDDPPLPTLRGHGPPGQQAGALPAPARPLPQPSNALEFCQGTIAEMVGEMDVYEAIDTYSKAGRIAYVHFRNVRGKVPEYHEVFVDEGDVDMVRALRIYHRNGYDGVIIPDHTPQMDLRRPLARRHGLRPRLDARRPALHRGRAGGIGPVTVPDGLTRPERGSLPSAG